MMGNRRYTVVLGLAVAITGMATPGAAYVHNTLDIVDGRVITTRWNLADFPIPMWATTGFTTDITDGSDRVAVQSAMASWSAISGSRAGLFLAGEGDVEANVLDGINAIEFSNSPDLDGSSFVSLTFLATDLGGTILEADVLVNDRVIGFTTSAGSNVGLDLETQMLRELGRVLGLTSSPVGAVDLDQTVNLESAVMYPAIRGISEIARSLLPDDAAGMIAIYPSGTDFGSISGFLTRNDRPLFGASVLAFDPVQNILVGVVSHPDGSYTIGGLPAGRYLLEVVPLTGRVTPASLGGIYDSEAVDTTFSEQFFTQVVRIAAGENATGVSLEVD